MKKQRFTPFSAANTAALAMIGTALILIVFLTMSLLGLIHPRKTRITLTTSNLSYTYDGKIHEGSAPTIYRGQLLPGHSIEIRDLPRVDKVGEYENKPQFIITDETGADVTNYYEIRAIWGELNVEPRYISLTCTGGNKLYDGEPLRASALRLVTGTLVSGDRIVEEGYNEIVLPGTVTAQPQYRIINQDGVDVTDQYHATEVFPHLTVDALKIYITTGSAEQTYDGTPLVYDQWDQTGGTLLDGHSMQVRVTGSRTDAGVGDNTAEVRFYDAQGRDVSGIYQLELTPGRLTVHQLPLYIRTGSAEKIYDGEALTCEEYKIISGKLLDGEQIMIRHLPKLTDVGTVENAIGISILDSAGLDVTHRYNIQYDFGKLTLQPLAIRIKTATATKVYDGTVLYDNSYSVLSGQLVAGDTLELECAELFDIGYTENYVKGYSVYRKVNDLSVDVTANYRISIEYGSLEITAY